MVGVPVAMADPAAAKTRQPRQLVGDRRAVTREWRRNDVANAGGELGGDALVGIDREHPISARQFECALLLRAETGPVGAADDGGAEAARPLAGVISAGPVDDDPFIGKCNRPEAGIDVGRFVFRDEDDRECDGAQERLR